MIAQLVAAAPLGPLFAEVHRGAVVGMRFDAPPPGATGRVVVGSSADQQVLEELVAAVGHWLDTGTDAFEVSVDLQRVGTFRARVYDCLRQVPAGSTVTYGELARRCGHDGAAQAVGQAMASNPWPLVVPCHRVVPAHGGVGGFAGGSARKSWMLAVERAGGAAQLGP